MKKTLLITFLCISAIQLNAQTYFNVDFGNDSSTNTVGGLVYEFNDTSGYLAVGAAPITDSRHLIFYRLNSLGDTVWTKIHGYPNLARSITIGKYVNLNDNELVFPGHLWTDSITQSTDTSLAMLFKIDTGGTVLWELYYGDTAKQTYTSDIQITKDNGFIITGWTNGWGVSSISNTFLLKVDSLGNEEWHRTYVIAGQFSYGIGIDTTNNNDLIMSGTVNLPGNIQSPFILRTDSVGNVIWQQLYGGPNSDAGYQYITKCDVNNYILTGGINIDYGNGLNSEFYIVKIDGNNGNIIWSDTTGRDGLEDLYTSEAIVLNNGNIAIPGGHISPNNATLHLYDGNGNFIWERVFNKYGTNNNNTFWDIHQTHDKGFILSGDLTNISIGEQRLWVLKLDSNGCEIPNCSVSIEDVISVLNKVVIYPNPTTNQITLENYNTPYNVSLYNTIGQVLYFEAEVNDVIREIDLSNLKNGLYFIKTEIDGVINTHKIIKQ